MLIHSCHQTFCCKRMIAVQLLELLVTVGGRLFVGCVVIGGRGVPLEVVFLRADFWV